MKSQQEAIDKVAWLIQRARKLKVATHVAEREATAIAEKELFNGDWLTTDHQILVSVADGVPTLTHIDPPEPPDAD